jgi:ribosomal protein L10
MKSKTNTKNQLIFRGAKYGESSYKLQFDNLQEGEYGIVVANPDNVDEKKAIVSCFGVDK